MKNALGVVVGLALVAALAACNAKLAPAMSPDAFTAIILADPHLNALGAVAFGGLVINRDSLNIIFTGFKTAFQNGLGMAASQWDRVATRVPSSTSEEKYGWLGKVPGLRKWIGDRVIHNIAVHDYTIKNDDFEDTIVVNRNNIDDDTYGVFAPLFAALGEAVSAHPNQLVFDLLKAGFDTLCYDGQNFFDTDHPVIDANGDVGSVANTDGGAGAPWFLIDDKRVLKPILYQVRKEAANLIRKDREEDDNVFDRNEYKYGVHGRCNVGFGFWQFAWGSKQTLNKANYKLARESLLGVKGDHGRPLGVMPRLLVVGASLENAALEIVNAERDAAGATNVYKGTAEVLVVPWLA